MATITITVVNHKQKHLIKMWLKKVMFCCFVTKLVSAGYIGDSCNVNGKEGTCVLINYCPFAISAIRFTHFHLLPRCGFQGTSEIVCCPSPAVDVKTLRPADRACQYLIDNVELPEIDYILGGEVAEAGEFPHMVALGYKTSGNYVFQCGGSLISQRFVLTAVHCVNTIDRVQPSLVRVGVLNITGSGWNDDTDYEIERIYVHPNYTRSRKYHDLALLRLAKSMSYLPNVFPACLYTKKTEPSIPLIVTGWGITDVTRSATSNVLLKAVLRIVPRETCNLKYTKTRKLPNGIAEGQICAGDSSGIMDTCQGDSGGPLQGQTSSDGHYRLVGITSFGSGCGSSVPGVYTRIFKYLDWIESIVWPSP